MFRAGLELLDINISALTVFIKGCVRSKIGNSATKRIVYTGKKGNKNFYKGKGANKGGLHTCTGKYLFSTTQGDERFTIIAPDLTGFKLKPYVAPTTPKVK